MPALRTKNTGPAVSQALLQLPETFPDLPAEVQERFPETKSYREEVTRWWTQAVAGLNDFSHAVVDKLPMSGVLKTNPENGSIFIRQINGPGVWNEVDTAYYVDKRGFFSLGNSLSWNPDTKQLTLGSLAGFIMGEEFIRDFADSFGLSSVTTGSDDVRFWSGATFLNRDTAPFRIYESGSVVALSGNIGGFILGTDHIRDENDSTGLAATVSGGDDVRFWAGSPFANRAAAPFRVTEAGVLVATNASLTGSITATGGFIGGFAIGPDYVRDVPNSMGLASTVTAGDDVRFWAGDTHANRAIAPFRVTQSGVLVATNATLTGSVTATGGFIGGFEIGPDYVRDSVNSMGIASTVTGGNDVRFWAGNTYANRATAPFRVLESGAITASNATLAGEITASSGGIGGFEIGPDFIRDTANSFGLAATITGGNDVRMWAGSTFAARATAPFRVLENGAFTATDATITGAITATDGFIGGWNIAPTSLTSTSGTGILILKSDTAEVVVAGATSSGQFTAESGVPRLLLLDNNVIQVDLRTSATGGNILLRSAADVITVNLDGGTGDATFNGDVVADTGQFADGVRFAVGANLIQILWVGSEAQFWVDGGMIGTLDYTP